MKRDKVGHNDQRTNSRRRYNNSKYIYAPNIGALQYVRQMITSREGEINSNTKIVGDLDSPVTLKDRSTKQKIKKETQTLSDTID